MTEDSGEFRASRPDNRSILTAGWPLLAAVACCAIGLPFLARLDPDRVTGTATATLIGLALLSALMAAPVMVRMPAEQFTRPFVGLAGAVAALLALAPLDHPAAPGGLVDFLMVAPWRYALTPLVVHFTLEIGWAHRRRQWIGWILGWYAVQAGMVLVVIVGLGMNEAPLVDAVDHIFRATISEPAAAVVTTISVALALLTPIRGHILRRSLVWITLAIVVGLLPFFAANFVPEARWPLDGAVTPARLALVAVPVFGMLAALSLPFRDAAARDLMAYRIASSLLDRTDLPGALQRMARAIHEAFRARGVSIRITQPPISISVGEAPFANAGSDAASEDDLRTLVAPIGRGSDPLGELRVESNFIGAFGPQERLWLSALLQPIADVLRAHRRELTNTHRSDEMTSQLAQRVTVLTRAAHQLPLSPADAGIAVPPPVDAREVLGQLSDGVTGIARHGEGLAITAASARESARGATDAVAHALDALAALAEQVIRVSRHGEEIATSNDTVSGVAFRTNLVANNAALEATRAGTAGRTFAVLAEEVRRLADTTAATSAAIGEHTSALARDVTTVATVVEAARQALGKAIREAEAGEAAAQRLSDVAAELEDAARSLGPAVAEANAVAKRRSARDASPHLDDGTISHGANGDGSRPDCPPRCHGRTQECPRRICRLEGAAGQLTAPAAPWPAPAIRAPATAMPFSLVRRISRRPSAGSLHQFLERLRSFCLDHITTPAHGKRERSVEHRQITRPKPPGLSFAQVNANNRLPVPDLILERSGVSSQVQAAGQRVEMRSRVGWDQRIDVEIHRRVLKRVPTVDVAQLREHQGSQRVAIDPLHCSTRTPPVFVERRNRAGNSPSRRVLDVSGEQGVGQSQPRCIRQGGRNDAAQRLEAALELEAEVSQRARYSQLLTMLVARQHDRRRSGRGVFPDQLVRHCRSLDAGACDSGAISEVTKVTGDVSPIAGDGCLGDPHFLSVCRPFVEDEIERFDAGDEVDELSAPLSIGIRDHVRKADIERAVCGGHAERSIFDRLDEHAAALCPRSQSRFIEEMAAEAVQFANPSEVVDGFSKQVVGSQVIASGHHYSVQVALLARHAMQRVDTACARNQRQLFVVRVNQELGPGALNRQRFDTVTVRSQTSVFDQSAQCQPLERARVGCPVERYRQFEVGRVDAKCCASDRQSFGVACQLEVGRTGPKRSEVEFAIRKDHYFAASHAAMHATRHLEDFVGTEIQAMQDIPAPLDDVAVPCVVDHDRVEAGKIQRRLPRCRHCEEIRLADFTFEKWTQDPDGLAAVIERGGQPRIPFGQLDAEPFDFGAGRKENGHRTPRIDETAYRSIVEEFGRLARNNRHLRLEGRIKRRGLEHFVAAEIIAVNGRIDGSREPDEPATASLAKGQAELEFG